MENILIHIGIGIVVVVGFFWYWGKSSGVFKEGGIINEWWKNYREKKKQEKSQLTKKD